MSANRCSPSGIDVFTRGAEALLRHEIHDALECLNHAQRLGFDARECAAARWTCWMLLGQFERAWAESDFIAVNGAGDIQCLWDGRPWNGKRVMLRGLHGLGDTIQFVRYAGLLKTTCRTVAVQAHPQLVSLLRCARNVDYVTTWRAGGEEPSIEWDVQIEVTELPRIFRTTLESIPDHVPYLQLPQQRVAWGRTCLPSREKLRIGLTWEAGHWNQSRSIPLQELEPLFAGDAHEWYSLQKDADLKKVAGLGRLRELEKYSSDVLDTAALIQNLDLVVSVDTMTAHLAGALRRPVWIILPFHCDWRWMLSRNDTPWYPTARLFRQTTPGDWTSVVAQVASELGSPRLNISRKSGSP
jgi:hypothetical protein